METPGAATLPPEVAPVTPPSKPEPKTASEPRVAAAPAPPALKSPPAPVVTEPKTVDPVKPATAIANTLAPAMPPLPAFPSAAAREGRRWTDLPAVVKAPVLTPPAPAVKPAVTPETPSTPEKFVAPPAPTFPGIDDVVPPVLADRGQEG